VRGSREAPAAASTVRGNARESDLRSRHCGDDDRRDKFAAKLANCFHSIIACDTRRRVGTGLPGRAP